ncbi:MAG: heme exporter protein CcmB [Dehalococcoidia bacterium]
MSYWRAIGAIVWKDLLVEVRGKEIIISVSFFVLLMVLTFNFAFKPGTIEPEVMTPGVLWFTFLFAGMLSFQRVISSEQENNCREGLMLCPQGRDVIFLAKLASSFLFVLLVEAISLPIFTVIFNLSVLPLQLLVIIPLATLGIAVIGTLLSVLSMNTRLQAVMLPILLIPLVAPAVIGAVESTSKAFSGEPWSEIQPWIWVLIAFDVVFLVLGLLTFEHVLEI